MGRPVVHWEFWSGEPGKVADFYEKAFDWKINHIQEMDYRLVETGGEGGINGGITGGEQASSAFYVEVDDPQAYLDRIEAAGGKTIVPVTVVPGASGMRTASTPPRLSRLCSASS